MKKQLLKLAVIVFGILLFSTATTFAKPIWTFSVVVAVEKQTADYYQRAYSKDIKLIVNEQFATVNANFNKSNNFNGTYNFQVDSIYVFDGPVAKEVFRSHSGYKYAIVIDGFFDGSVGGGWWGSYQTIYHAWKWDTFDGPFAQYATDGLTHELSHARGGVDIYGMRVEGAKNPVNGQTFEPVNSIMNYPYGNITWDEYTTNLLNSTGPDPIVGEQWITKPFPAAIGLKAVDNQGVELTNVSLEMYPVDWFSYSVSPKEILRYFTGSAGSSYIFPANPFQPSTSGYPWNIRYANFLIKATYNSVVVYKWLPLYDVQNDYFRNGASSFYNVVIQFPVSTPTIRLSSAVANSFNPGDPITVSFISTGIFEPTNQFSLFVVDKDNNSYEIGRVSATSGSTITGVIPAIGSVSNKYRVRVVSSRPQVQSDDYVISIPPKPVNLTLGAPAYNCATGAISFNVSGGDGSPITFSAPGIARSRPTDYTGVVENELRRDPKVIPITATQAGISVTYNFDLRAACGATPLPPILNQPIPDQVFRVGQLIYSGSGFAVGHYFSDPTPYIPAYNSGWRFQVDGLPDGLYVLEKSLPPSPSPIQTILGIPTTIGIYTVTIKASTAAFPDRPVFARFNIEVSGDANPASKLTLLQPSYTCQTGAITFRTVGGDGSPVTFSAPGIRRSSPTSNTGIVEAELRSDPKPILIEATQRGQTSTYLFDFKAYCSDPKPVIDALSWLTPNYDCQSGAIHFNTAGGDGSPIEFMAPGITGWTTTPDQYVDRESRTAIDVAPFTFMARQNGVTVSYVWNLKAACGRARQGVVNADAGLSVQVLGNPVNGQVRVSIRGVDGESVQLRLTDLRGYVLESRLIGQAGSNEIQSFDLSYPGSAILLLQATSNQTTRTVRIIKQ